MASFKYKLFDTKEETILCLISTCDKLDWRNYKKILKRISFISLSHAVRKVIVDLRNTKITFEPSRIKSEKIDTEIIRKLKIAFISNHPCSVARLILSIESLQSKARIFSTIENGFNWLIESSANSVDKNLFDDLHIQSGSLQNPQYSKSKKEIWSIIEKQLNFAEKNVHE